MKNQIWNRLYYILIAIIICEIVLGGLGNLMGLPIRKTLLVIGTLVTLSIIYKERRIISKNYLIWIGLFMMYVIIGGIVGLLNGNDLGDIISDGNVFLGIVYLLFLVCLVKDNINNLDHVCEIIINCSVVVAIITIGLFLYSGFFLPEDVTIIDRYMNLNQNLNYGLITGLVYSGRFARIYLFNGIYMQIAASLVIIKIIHQKAWNNILAFKLLILGLGIFVSSTRGFWLGFLVVILFSIFYFFRRKISKFITVLQTEGYLKKIIIIFTMLILLIIVGSFVTINQLASVLEQETQTELINGEDFNQISGSESFGSRVFSIFDFKNNLSNKIRFVQAQFLAARIQEKPILGWGFGAHIEEYKQYMEDSNMPPVDSSSFELYYIELLFKTGIIGLGLLIGYFVYRIFVLFRILLHKKISLLEKELLIGWTIAFLSLVVSSFTNPYLGSLTGFFSLVMFIYVVETIIIKYR